jgi:VWFA-related protein
MNAHVTIWRVAVCGICVLTVFLGTEPVTTLFAQESEEPRSTFYAPLDVPLVNVDVYVTDKKGRPVNGLGIEDFRVFEDGNEVEITHFYASPGVALPSREPAEATARQPIETGVEETPIQDLFFVVFIDDTNLSRGRRQAAIDHLRSFLESKTPPGLNMMMVSYDGRLQIAVPFTTDVGTMLSALDDVSKMASLGRRSEEDMIIRNMEATRRVAENSGNQEEDIMESGGIAHYQEIHSYADQLYERSRTGCKNLNRLVRSLSGLPGRKALLLVNDGVEPRPGERLFRYWGQVFGSVPIFETEAQMAFFRANENSLNNEFNELARYANSHRVTLYTLSTIQDGQMRAISAETRVNDEQRLSVIQSMSEDVLAASMATQTGGRPLVNSPALAQQLGEVSEELTSFYSLAFRPEHVGDGSYHRIGVELRRSGLNARHREGYYDIPPAERLNDRTLAAAIHGVGSNEMGVAIKAFDPTKREDGAYLLPIIVVIPIGELILMPTADEHRGRISILLAVRDENGGLSEIERREYPVVVPNELLATAIGKTAGFTMRLAVRGGKQRIAVSVLDEIARTESVTTLDLEVPGSGG